MAYYNKIWLVVVNKTENKMLVLEERLNNKDHSKWTIYKIIGWTIKDNEDPIQCLIRETKEEIGCDIDLQNLTLINTYIAPAAWQPRRDVSITLYQWSIMWTPVAQINDPDIIDIVWIQADQNLPWLQQNIILKDHIIPDLIAKKLLSI